MPNSSFDALVQEASALVVARTGLSSQSQQRINLESVLNELSSGDLAGFVRRLHATADNAPGWQRLLRTLVISETYFFRYQAHFDLLRTHILPELTKQRPEVNIWSAGCATGEEIYSVAMTLCEYLPNLAQSTTRLVGTDISAEALDTARRGIYRPWAFRGTEGNLLTHYFNRVENGLQIKSTIQTMVTFRQANLLAGSPLPQCQVIFCCNVLLYFEAGAVNLAEDVLFDALTPGGWLILGPAEAVRSQRNRWITHIFPGAVVYQKPITQSILSISSTPATVYHTDHLNRNTAKTSHQRTASPRAIPEDRYAAAVDLFRAKQYDEAGHLLHDILSNERSHIAAHTLYACLFANQGMLAEAQEQVQAALAIDALHADAHYLKGVLLLDTQREEAAECFRAAIYCQQGHALAAMILGTIYLRDGNTARARRTWETALQALEGIAPETHVSDISDLTVGGIRTFLINQLQDQ